MDLLIKNIAALYRPAAYSLSREYQVSIGIENGLISYIGKAKDLPKAKRVVDARNYLCLPGLIDPHPHAIWGGSRAKEFARRLAGESYTKILEEGGGILSTVTQTRTLDKLALSQGCQNRLQTMLSHGVCTVEVKSGYGLNPETERRLLMGAKEARTPLDVTTTFLGAHTIPKDYRNNRDAYVRQIIEEQLPVCAPHADAIDVYCDRGAFTLDESIEILKAGRAMGLKLKAHAEQVAHTGISAAAAQLGALSVDHLERATDSDIAVLRENDTVAVLLPGAQLYLRDSPPPVDSLREAGVKMAIGTDLNPGSSPVHSSWTCATLSCILQRLTMEEAVLGMTIHAAQAIGQPEKGTIELGNRADLILVQPPYGEPMEIESVLQHLGHSPCKMTIKDGHIVYSAP